MAGGPTGAARRACIGLLQCPVCGAQLGDCGAAARCVNGHSFDFARRGYLNLAPTTRHRRVGASTEMVAARQRLLDRGFLAPVMNAVAELAAGAADEPRVIAELGSGTGHYLEALTEVAASVPPHCAVGMDLSVAAVRSASRRLPGALLVVADLQEGIPLRSSSVELLASVFAPRPLGEIARVTRHGGGLVLAFAAPDHMAELRERCRLLDVHPRKLEDIRARVRDRFAPVETRHVAYDLELEPDDVDLLIGMGPNARHMAPSIVAGPQRTHASVVVASFRRLRC